MGCSLLKLNTFFRFHPNYKPVEYYKLFLTQVKPHSSNFFLFWDTTSVLELQPIKKGNQDLVRLCQPEASILHCDLYRSYDPGRLRHASDLLKDTHGMFDASIRWRCRCQWRHHCTMKFDKFRFYSYVKVR